MTIELNANAIATLTAIAQGAEIPVTGPAKGAAIGSLKRKGLITKNDDGNWETTPDGFGWFEEHVAQQETKKAAPKHNERTLGHVAAVREALPKLTQTDDEIAAVVWRVATAERAVEKAKEAFAA